MKITIAGIGYVGISTAVVFAKKHKVLVSDISSDRLRQIEEGRSPVEDEDIEGFLSREDIDLIVSKDTCSDYKDSDFIIIATSTNYDEEKGSLDTSSIISVVEDIKGSGSNACVVVKSTVSTGFMEMLHNRYEGMTFIFVPEFLREGKAIYDQLHPSRIVIGYDKNDPGSEECVETYLSMLMECIDQKEAPVLKMSFGEAEAVKLFSNTYLAMRVAFFNELDTFAEEKGYDTRKIIDGVCADPRIGDYYNNPSFGYGGYCLPKDTKQLLSIYDGIPQKMISATVDTNEVRKRYIAQRVIDMISENTPADKEGIVGIYRLTMKKGSKNFRESSILGVIDHLREQGCRVLIYEPTLDKREGFDDIEVIDDLDLFKEKSQIILANRMDQDLEDVEEKVYTRDVYRIN